MVVVGNVLLAVPVFPSRPFDPTPQHWIVPFPMAQVDDDPAVISMVDLPVLSPLLIRVGEG